MKSSVIVTFSFGKFSVLARRGKQAKEWELSESNR